MTGRKRKVNGRVRVKAYPVMSEAVERGVAYGYHRAHKHNPKPDAETIKDAILEAVMAEIGEKFSFDDEDCG
jgi:hypothetical protein